jgi:uncharacterized protein involved in exopolysaccharide biosynthesis
VTPDSGTAPPTEITLAELLHSVRARWRWWTLAPLVGALLGAVTAVLWPKTWAASASFVPEQTISGSGGGLLGAIGSIGSLLGDNAGALGKLKEGPSGEFFADVLDSQELLVATLRSSFADPEAPGTTRPLLDLLKPRGDSPAQRLGNAMRSLRKKKVVTLSRRSGIVSLTVTLRDADLSAAVANRMLTLLNEFNLERRQLTSADQRRFSEQRLVIAQRELDSVTAARGRFLETNRDLSNSPRLLAQYDELDRLVRVKEGVLLGLTRAFEESRVSEMRNTALITIVDHAITPDRPKQRPLPWGAAGAAVLFVIAIGLSAVLSVGGPARAPAVSGLRTTAPEPAIRALG